VNRILVIDDEAVIRDLMVEILERAGYEVVGAETAGRALELLDDVTVVVSDIVMPGLSGIDLLDEVRKRRPSLPVVLVTGAGTYENLSDAVGRGADGFVMKPFSHADLQRAVAAAIERARRAEQDLRERLLAPTLAAALGNAIEARDSGMEGHCERLSALAIRLGESVGLAREELEQIRLGAVLHDIGKIGIPDSVLLKAGPLAPDELAFMRTHTLIGDRLLAPLELLAGVRPIVRHHHERWDGAGYPDGLAGEAIPLAARIVALADSIEAMSAHRIYRGALGREAILGELASGRGAQWDPRLVDLALELVGSGELNFDENGLELLSYDGIAERPSIQSVLLVEENREDATAAARALEDAFAEVRVVRAESVERGLELFRSSSWHLAIVDPELPDGSGLDFLDTVRALCPSLPVVMLTGQEAESIAVEAFRRGATDYVVKTNGFTESLTGRVRGLLEVAA
jgi:putative two-component system response regulator